MQTKKLGNQPASMVWDGTRWLELWNDGQHDDTEAIQALLHGGVQFPIGYFVLTDDGHWERLPQDEIAVGQP